MGDTMGVRLLCRTALVAVLFLITTSAFAHHVMGGEIPSTFIEGLLSGIGHPIIGPDHLAFLLAIGVAAGIGGFQLASPAPVIVVSRIWVVVHVKGSNMPRAGVIVSGS